MSKLIERVEKLATEVFGAGAAVSIDVDGVRVWNQKGECQFQAVANTQTSGLKQVREFLAGRLSGLTDQLTESVQIAKMSAPDAESGKFPVIVNTLGMVPSKSISIKLKEEAPMAAKKKTAAKKTRAAKAPKVESTARAKKLLIRFSDEERKALGANAEKHGKPLAQYIRDRCCI